MRSPLASGQAAPPPRPTPSCQTCCPEERGREPRLTPRSSLASPRCPRPTACGAGLLQLRRDALHSPHVHAGRRPEPRRESAAAPPQRGRAGAERERGWARRSGAGWERERGWERRSGERAGTGARPRLGGGASPATRAARGGLDAGLRRGRGRDPFPAGTRRVWARLPPPELPRGRCHRGAEPAPAPRSGSERGGRGDWPGGVRQGRAARRRCPHHLLAARCPGHGPHRAQGAPMAAAPLGHLRQASAGWEHSLSPRVYFGKGILRHLLNTSNLSKSAMTHDIPLENASIMIILPVQFYTVNFSVFTIPSIPA